MNKATEPSYVSETVTIIRPTTSNHIWNDEKYERVESYTKEGNKIVLLIEKVLDTSS